MTAKYPRVLGATLDDAEQWVEDNREDGAECPCCGQLAKVYKRPLNVTMARGLDADATLARWRRLIKERTAVSEEGLRATLGIDLVDRGGQFVVASWRLVECWPMSLTTDDLSNASDVLVQRVSFSVEEIKQTLPASSLTYARP